MKGFLSTTAGAASTTPGGVSPSSRSTLDLPDVRLDMPVVAVAARVTPRPGGLGLQRIARMVEAKNRGDGKAASEVKSSSSKAPAAGEPGPAVSSPPVQKCPPPPAANGGAMSKTPSVDAPSLPPPSDPPPSLSSTSTSHQPTPQTSIHITTSPSPPPPSTPASLGSPERLRVGESRAVLSSAETSTDSGGADLSGGRCNGRLQRSRRVEEAGEQKVWPDHSLLDTPVPPSCRLGPGGPGGLAGGRGPPGPGSLAKQASLPSPACLQTHGIKRCQTPKSGWI